MKGIMKAVCSVIMLIIFSTHSFVVSAINFDAEQTFDSVFVVISDNSLGSGFALGTDCVITNAHVIENQEDVTVTAYDGTVYRAYVYKMSERLDIAVLSVPTADFTPLTIEDKSNIKIGEDVFAIGAPNGMSYTLTKGTLSSSERTIKGQNYLQIDAALNEGNSGGPLLSSNGKVIGMNTMKIENSEGIGLAIPIDRIISYMEENGAKEESGYYSVSTVTSSDTELKGETTGTEKHRKENTDDCRYAISILLCVTIICNIILLLIMLRYKKQYKRLKELQSERTDFEIDFWE